MIGRKARRQALRREVHVRLAPHLESLGFESTKKRATKEACSKANRGGYGYGRRRDGQIDLLDIQWEKYGRPRFALNFATYDAAEIESARLPASWRSGRLHSGHYPFPCLLLEEVGQWFGHCHRAGPAIDLAILRTAELEDFFRTGRQGPHVSISLTSGGALAPHPKRPLMLDLPIDLLRLLRMLLRFPFLMVELTVESWFEEEPHRPSRRGR